MAKDGWLGITSLNSVALGIAAVAYGKAGLPVFPMYWVVSADDGALRCSCQASSECENPGKHPLVNWSEQYTTDEGQIQQWWSDWPQANIGIPTGSRSDLIVLDLDLDEIQQVDASGMSYPATMDGQAEFAAWLERETGGQSDLEQLLSTTAVQKTGSGGLHVWLTDPGGVKTISKWLPACDIKADGGYVVVSPSRHISGNRYAWTNQNSPEALPETVAIKLQLARGHRARRTVPEGGGSDGSEVAGLFSQKDLEQHAQTGPPPGQRDDFFNSYAFVLRKRGWPEAEATQEIQRVWAITPGGGAAQDGVSPYRWETARDKVGRVWREVDPDPTGGEIQQELLSWVQGGLGGPTPPQQPPSGAQVTDRAEHPTEIATDWGNIQRFARLRSSRLRFVRGQGWMLLDGYRWQRDELNSAIYSGVQEVIADIMQQAERSPADQAQTWATWARQTQSSTRINAMVKLAEMHPDLALAGDRLDADPWLLATGSGVIDLRTWPAPGSVRQGRLEDYCTRMIGVSYDPAADPRVACPRWLEHVALVTSTASGRPDPGLAEYLQRWAGYSLTGLVREQRFAFCFGEGDNGKNVFIETLVAVLGSYAQTGSFKLLTGSGQEHETVIADLAGPRLVFIDETPKGRVNESRIKQLTGTKRIRARRIAKDSFEFAAQFKLWIAGNNRPRVADTSRGFWRRLDLIPFDAIIPAQRRVKDYAQILVQDEGPGILNWMLQGLVAYRELGLEQPTRVVLAGQSYREEEDQVGQFVSETFDFRADRANWVWHPNFVIHGLYASWCESNGVRNFPSMQQLAGDLERHKLERDPVPRRVRPGFGSSKAMRGWWGPPCYTDLPTHLSWQ